MMQHSLLKALARAMMRAIAGWLVSVGGSDFEGWLLKGTLMTMASVEEDLGLLMMVYTFVPFIVCSSVVIVDESV